MPKTTVAHADEMRQRILDGARRAMQVGGSRETSVPAIAAEAGVSVGLIYRYYPSKEELRLSVCEQVTREHLEALDAQMSQIGDPRERLRSAVDLVVQSLANEDWGLMVTDVLAESDRDDRLRTLLRERCEQIRRFSIQFLEDARSRGELRNETDLERLSLGTAMLLDGVIAHVAELGQGFDPQPIAEAMLALLEPQLVGSEALPRP